MAGNEGGWLLLRTAPAPAAPDPAAPPADGAVSPAAEPYPPPSLPAMRG